MGEKGKILIYKEIRKKNIFSLKIILMQKYILEISIKVVFDKSDGD